MVLPLEQVLVVEKSILTFLHLKMRLLRNHLLKTRNLFTNLTCHRPQLSHPKRQAGCKFTQFHFFAIVLASFFHRSTVKDGWLAAGGIANPAYSGFTSKTPNKPARVGGNRGNNGNVAPADKPVKFAPAPNRNLNKPLQEEPIYEDTGAYVGKLLSIK